MAAFISGTPFEYIIVALAVASSSVTITRSSVFKPLRDKFDWKLLHCPYCLSHWIAAPFAWMFGIVGVFAVIGLSTIFSLPILEKFDATGT